METIIYNKYSNERIPEFNIRTEIVSDKGVKKICKYATDVEGVQHVRNMYETYKWFRELFGRDKLQVCPCEIEEDRVVLSFIEGDNLKDILLDAVARNNFELFYSIFDCYVRYLNKYSKLEKFIPCESFINIFGLNVPKYDGCIRVFKPANIDMVFDNIIEKDEAWYIVDYEWTFNITVPVEFILYRAIFYLIYNSPYQSKFEEMDLYGRAGINKEDLSVYCEMEKHFQSYVVGSVHAVKEYYQPGIDVKDIFVNRLWEKDEIIFSIYEDNGNGFSEREKKIYKKKLDNSGGFTFSYQFPDTVSVVRVDPGELPLFLELFKPLEGVIETNGEFLEDNTLYFANSDPWILIDKGALKCNEISWNGRLSRVHGLAHDKVNKIVSDNNRIVSDNNRIISEYDKLTINYDRILRENAAYNQALNQVYNSRSWKMTSGFRKLGGIVKKCFKKELISNADIPGIAIHLHLFYVDLLPEFVEYFKNISYPFNLYISCVKGADEAYIKEYTKRELPNMQKVVVKILPNRGRDIAPFYVGFGKEILQHKYVLHVHSKKSKHIETGGGDWRVYSLDSLLGSTELIENIINKFEKEASVGLMYPEVHPDIPMIGFTWMANGDGGQAFLNEMGIPYERGLFSYPTGSFFWARVDAIKPIFEKGLTYKDFPDEKGQIDGTLAHVLERAIAFVNKACGFHSYIIDTKEKIMRYDRSTKPFRDYMKLDVESIKKELMQYDSISFGVFDTLLASDYLREEDLFLAVQQKFGLSDEYVMYRKEAQRISKEKYGAFMSIDEIYMTLTEISPFDENAAMELKQAELDLLNQRLYPRYEMREVYRYLLECGKKVSIVCDSYYRTPIIEGMLARAGFLGFERLFVSCDYGYSKRDEQMWNVIYQQYNESSHIHVGSDVYADWYTLERRGAKSRWIMSGTEAYKLSKYYDDNNKSLSLEESIELGSRINRKWFNSTLDLIHHEGML